MSTVVSEVHAEFEAAKISESLEVVYQEDQATFLNSVPFLEVHLAGQLPVSVIVVES